MAFIDHLSFRRILAIALACAVWVFHAQAQNSTAAETPATRAERFFLETRAAYETNRTNVDAGIHFIRAAFDWAEFAKTEKQRAQIADQGIAASRELVERAPKSAAAHYYLGMNLGQLARTKSLGALKIVDEMEIEFQVARALDANFDYAGPDRNLGLLYREAPVWGSVGDRKKARVHLERALKLAPEFPENRLNYIEVCLLLGERKTAEIQFKKLRESWSDAKKTLVGPEWQTSWADWEKRSRRISAQLPNVKS